MRLFFILAFALFSSTTTFACGHISVCGLADDRHYHIKLPDGMTKGKRIGAIFFAHGLGGSSQGVVDNPRLFAVADRLGLALVGLKAKREDWNVKNSPAGRSDRSSNEYDYLDDVISDIRKRFDIDPDRLVLSGVSVGGTFTWTMACTGRARFAAYLPISGTYWLSPPRSCRTKPQNIIHIHGTSDKTVPLAGRRVGSSAHSNVHHLLKAYAAIGRYRPSAQKLVKDLRCDRKRNARGQILEFCRHSGGHYFRASDIEYALRRFISVGIL